MRKRSSPEDGFQRGDGRCESPAGPEEGGFRAPPPKDSKGRRTSRYRGKSVPDRGNSGGTADQIRPESIGLGAFFVR